MENFQIEYPIFTLDNKELFSAGSIITEESLEALIASNKSPQPVQALSQYGSVKKDILRFLGEPPYSAIFQDTSQKGFIFDIMDRVEVIGPILECLNYYKKNDFYTYRHLLMVFVVAVFLAKYLIPEFKPGFRDFAAAPAHDFGKLCVPLNILKKNGTLSKMEQKKIRHHPIAGYVLLSYYLRDPKNIIAIVARDHHEKKDGSGYPCGISQSRTMVEIVTVGDIYDALISPRPYRSASYSNRAALEELTDMASQNKIGWDVVKTLIGQYRKDKPDIKDIKLSKERRTPPPPQNNHGKLKNGD
jgi:HD-GYP domain-containing protein (c-di-GMP phosphodiesterase class II)